MIFGIDVHTGYGPIDWTKCKAAGVRFAWLKCTEGNKNYVDEQFWANAHGCEANGIPCGAYHYAFPLPEDPAHAGRSPAEQVERAFAGCNGMGSRPGELAHFVDAEWPEPQDAAKWGCTRPQISAWLREYCDRATIKWGRKPVIYTYGSWWRWLSQGADVSWASEYLLFFADYGWPHEGAPPDDWTPPHLSWVSQTWTDWAVCQFSAEGSSARVPGINACPVDRDCIRSETMLQILRGLYEPPETSIDIVHPLPDVEDS